MTAPVKADCKRTDGLHYHWYEYKTGRYEGVPMTKPEPFLDPAGIAVVIIFAVCLGFACFVSRKAGE